MCALTLDQANAIAQRALAQGRHVGLKPLTVAILDGGGHLIVLLRDDGASTMRPDIAIGKAAGALALGISSRRIADMAAERPSFVASLGTISPRGVIPAAGGVIIVDDDGTPTGAVGITGDSSDNDEMCALSAIEAAGFKAQD